MEVVERISLGEIVGVLRRRWLWFVVCPAVFVALVSAVNFSRTEEYKSTASLLFRRSPLVRGRVDGRPAADVRAVVKMLPGLAPSSQVMEKIRRGAASRNMSADGLWNKVLHATKSKEADIIRLSATTPSPALSRDLANAAADLAVRNYLRDYGRFALWEDRKELAQERDIAKKHMEDARDKLKEFEETSFLLPEVNHRAAMLRARRQRLGNMDLDSFREMIDLKEAHGDAVEVREKIVKLLAEKNEGGDGLWPLLLDINRLEAWMASHRALVADMLKAEGELAALLKTKGAGGASSVDAAAKTPRAAAGARTPYGLEKMQAAAESPENEKKEKLRERQVQDLRAKISGMRDEIKKVESKIFAGGARIGELIVARPDIFGDVKLKIATASPADDEVMDEKKMVPRGSPVNVLLDKWQLLNREMERAEQMRRTRDLLAAELKETFESLHELWDRRRRLHAQRGKLRAEFSLANRNYNIAFEEYRQATRRGASLRVIVPAALPARPTPVYWKASATMGVVAGLFLATCVVLFLEFRKAVSARKEPDGA